MKTFLLVILSQYPASTKSALSKQFQNNDFKIHSFTINNSTLEFKISDNQIKRARKNDNETTRIKLQIKVSLK